MTTKATLVTPNQDSVMDEANDAIRVNVVASSASGGDGAILDGASSSIKATVLDLTSANPLAVAITDGTGAQITSFGGGTQYADGTARGTATGTLMIGDDGTNVQSVKVDTSGVLAVQDNGGSLTVDGSVSVSNFPATYPVTDNAGSLTVDAPVATPVFVRLSDGAAAISALPVTDNAGSLTVDGSVTVTQGTGTNLHTVVDSGTISTITNVVHVDDNAGSLTVDGSVTVSGTVSINQTGTANDVDVATITGTGSIANNQVSVTTTSGAVVAARSGRRSLLIVNHGTTDVYLGTGTVTTSNGILLTGTKGASISIPTAAAVNGIVGSGTQTVSYIEVF